MAQLIALPAGSNPPDRLLFKAANQRERAIALAVTGAVANEKTGNITFPPEPFAVADLQLNLQLEMDHAVTTWFYDYVEAAKHAIQLSSMGDIQVEVGGDSFHAKLYPYQRVGAWWLRFVRRGILGDDMGLGKTVQSLAAVQDCKKILIVTVPIAEHSVWETHVERWLKRTAWVFDGEGKRRQSLLKSAARQDRVICIINHEMLQVRNQEKYPELWSIEWDAVIIDEAHKMQGRPARKREDGKMVGSQTTKGAELLKTDRLYQLTGTPVWNRPDSLYGLLHLLDPKRFSSYWRFVDEYCEVSQSEYGREIIGPKADAMERLHSLLAPMLLRRQKEVVLKDLPSKTVQVMEYELEGKLDVAYWKLKESYINPRDGTPEPSIPAAYADMRRLLNAPCLLECHYTTPKDEMIDSLVEQATDEGKPVVIFTWHNDYTAYLENRLGKTYTCRAIYGPVPTAVRDRILLEFQAGKLQVLVASMATMGVAVDLTAARVAIFAEGHYVNTVVQQAEDRLHRNGQKCDVMIYRLMASGTIEQAIWETADNRKQDADEVLALDEVHARVRAQQRKASNP